MTTRTTQLLSYIIDSPCPELSHRLKSGGEPSPAAPTIAPCPQSGTCRVTALKGRNNLAHIQSDPDLQPARSHKTPRLDKEGSPEISGRGWCQEKRPCLFTGRMPVPDHLCHRHPGDAYPRAGCPCHVSCVLAIAPQLRIAGNHPPSLQRSAPPKSSLRDDSVFRSREGYFA
jgi:hypothetical protein